MGDTLVSVNAAIEHPSTAASPLRRVIVYTPLSVDTAQTQGPDGHVSSVSPLSVPGPGTVLADRYRLVELVGRGGMGSVWKGEHLALGTTVAIKLINPALVDDPLARERFLREARAAAALRSPHVVQIFDHGVDAGTPYIAMELLEGESLAARLRRERSLSSMDALRILTQVLRAVAKAHEAGVVHRDLKPDNILLVAADDGTELAKVVDFGIAKSLDQSLMGATTQSGTIVGTAYYMSPEQLMRAGSIDTKVDLWAAAVITYECLLGRRPFQGESMGELAVALLVEPPPVPSRHGAVPVGFDAWFARATARDPEARFPDVHQLLEALERALAERVPAPEHPRRSWALLAMVGALALAGVGAFLISSARESPKDSPASPSPSPAPRAREPSPLRADTPAPAPAPALEPAPGDVEDPGARADVGSAAPARPRTSNPGKKQARPQLPAEAKKSFDVEDLEY